MILVLPGQLGGMQVILGLGQLWVVTAKKGRFSWDMFGGMSEFDRGWFFMGSWMAREVWRELGVQVDWFLLLQGWQGKCLNKECNFLAQFGQEHAHGAQDGSLLCKEGLMTQRWALVAGRLVLVMLSSRLSGWGCWRRKLSSAVAAARRVWSLGLLVTLEDGARGGKPQLSFVQLLTNFALRTLQ